MSRRELIKAIEAVLQTEIPVDAIAKGVERLMNAEIPGTPSISGRRGGARVMYVALPGKGKNREALSARAAQVLVFLDRNRKASSAALQKALDVNRNVIAGAVHELKQAGVVRTEAYAGAQTAAAASYEPRRAASNDGAPRRKRAAKR